MSERSGKNEVDTKKPEDVAPAKSEPAEEPTVAEGEQVVNPQDTQVEESGKDDDGPTVPLGTGVNP